MIATATSSTTPTTAQAPYAEPLHKVLVVLHLTGRLLTRPWISDPARPRNGRPDRKQLTAGRISSEHAAPAREDAGTAGKGAQPMLGRKSRACRPAAALRRLGR